MSRYVEISTPRNCFTDIQKGTLMRTLFPKQEEEMEYKTDIEIAQSCRKEKISDIAQRAGIPEEYLELYGNYKAKVDCRFLKDRADRPDGKLILVTLSPPRPPGRGRPPPAWGLPTA